jgi:hypothetical protein
MEAFDHPFSTHLPDFRSGRARRRGGVGSVNASNASPRPSRPPPSAAAGTSRLPARRVEGRSGRFAVPDGRVAPIILRLSNLGGAFVRRIMSIWGSRRRSRCWAGPGRLVLERADRTEVLTLRTGETRESDNDGWNLLEASRTSGVTYAITDDGIARLDPETGRIDDPRMKVGGEFYRTPAPGQHRRTDLAHTIVQQHRGVVRPAE